MFQFQQSLSGRDIPECQELYKPLTPLLPIRGEEKGEGWSFHMRVKSEAGFTLLELLISMTIGLVVLGSIFSSFTTQKKSYELQEQITVMEQNLRVPIDFITRDLRNAGYNPTEDLTTGTSVGLAPGTDSGVTTTIDINSIRILS